MKHLFTFFFSLLFFSFSHAQSVVYVTQNGAGNQSGGSWSDALPGTQLQARLGLAGAGTQFWIASGTYKPTTGTDRTISFAVPSGVQIYGGFVGNEATLANRTLTSPSSTTLSGDIGQVNDNIDNTYHIVRLTNVSASTRLDGLTITGGNANVSNLSDDNGGGIFNTSTQTGVVSSPTIANCSLIKNRAFYGAGMYNGANFGSTSNPTLLNCLFADNGAERNGGGFLNTCYNATANPVLTSCIFRSNFGSYNGGGLANISPSGVANPMIIDCSFEKNATFGSGGAIYNTSEGSTNNMANPIISRCTFTDQQAYINGGAICSFSTGGQANVSVESCAFLRNIIVTSGNGGAIFLASVNNARFTNCLFASNVAPKGGAVGTSVYTNLPCTPAFINCTFASNLVRLDANNNDNGSGAFYNSASSGVCTPRLTNCLLGENGARYASNRSGIVNEGSATITVNYSNIQGGFTGTGNIDADPLFVDAANGNYRLKSGSPAINAGDPGSTTATVSDKDLAGNPRIAQDRIDMGAYEFQVTSQNNADLSLNLRVNSRTSTLNQPVTYQLTVTNDGPITATNVVWQNRLPDNLVYVGGSNLSLNNGVLSGQLTSLAAGASATFTYQLSPSQPGQYRNAAQIIAADQPDPDSQPNSGTGDGQDDTSIADFRAAGGSPVYASANPNQTPLPNVQSNQPAPDPAKADLSMAMFVSNRTPKAGDVITVSITVSNAGGLPANGVTAQLALPTGVTLVSANEVSQFGSLGVNASVTRTLQLRVTGQGSVVLRAEVSGSDQPDPDSRPNSGADGEDDTVTVELRVQPAL